MCLNIPSQIILSSSRRGLYSVPRCRSLGGALVPPSTRTETVAALHERRKGFITGWPAAVPEGEAPGGAGPWRPPRCLAVTAAGRGPSVKPLRRVYGSYLLRS